jgi:hypothetical protein
MQKTLIASASAALLAACSLPPPAAAPAPEATFTPAAEPQISPAMAWTSTGKGLWIYHNVWGDCAFLEHGHGRNNAWGLWRLPLGGVTASAPEAAEDGGVTVTFACTDGSACIQAGALGDTPGRIGTHTIPFETLQGAERYLSEAASLDKACKRLK